MEQEVNMKLVCIMNQSAEKAERVFLESLTKFVSQQKQIKANSKSSVKPVQKDMHGGRIVKVKDLTKDGSQVEFVDMGKDNLKDFRKYARKYGVTYSMERNKETTPPTYLIYFKAKDGALINKAISSYVTDKMKSSEKENSLSEKLTDAKAQVGLQTEKVRKKEKVR